MTAKQVAQQSGLEVTVVNSQLTRLENEGYLEKVEVSGSGRSGYQLVERFFNIWYLMRHGSRRLKQRVCWLTAFLRSFYSAGDRESLARDYLRMGNHRGRADLMLALSESVADPHCRLALHLAAGQDLIQQSELRESIAHLVDLRDISPELADMQELKRQALAVQRVWPSGLDAASFWDLLGGSLEISGAEKRRIIEQLTAMDLEKLTELAAQLQQEIINLVNTIAISTELLTAYRAAVRNGAIHHRYDLDGACACALRDNNVDIAAVACLLILNDSQYGDLDSVRAAWERYHTESSHIWESFAAHSALNQTNSALRSFLYGLWLAEQGFTHEAEVALRKAGNLETDPNSQYRAWAWIQLGNLLGSEQYRYQEAEVAYREAIEIDPKCQYAWESLGSLLQYCLGRYEEAEAAYRQAIALDAKYAVPWYRLGNLLQEYLGRYHEAEEAYRQAIALDAHYAIPWNNLGNLLQAPLGRYQEAEAAYRQAIALDVHYATPWNNLGYLLEYHLRRYEEAEAAYRQAIALDAKLTAPWNGLGNVLQRYLGRYEEAETAFRQAIALDAKNAIPWHGLGNLLQDHLGRYEEAEAAYRQAIALDDKFAYPWAGLGYLLQEYLGRYEEAEAAYRHAIILDANYATPWNRLGSLFQDCLSRFDEAESCYLQELELCEATEKNYVHGRLAYLYWFDLLKPEAAAHHAQLGRQVAEPYIAQLLDAAEYLVAEEVDKAFAALDIALIQAVANRNSQFLVSPTAHTPLHPLPKIWQPISDLDGSQLLPSPLRAVILGISGANGGGWCVT